MGDNAQTSVPKFTSGDVLTAANTNLLSNGIPVFSGTATRDDSFGGTGEKTLAEGQFAFLEDTNTTQYYDGAAWQPVGTAPGLVYITGATFTAASTVIADGCFTSAYRNYKIFIDGEAASGQPKLRWYFRTSGVDNTGSTYFNGFLTSTANAVSVAEYAGAAAFGGISNFGDVTASLDLTLFAPQVAEKTKYNSLFSSFSATDGLSGLTSGMFNATTQFDGIKFFPASSTITGQYRIYGVANS
jgi:hypothetical protein